MEEEEIEESKYPPVEIVDGEEPLDEPWSEGVESVEVITVDDLEPDDEGNIIIDEGQELVIEPVAEDDEERDVYHEAAEAAEKLNGLLHETLDKAEGKGPEYGELDDMLIVCEQCGRAVLFVAGEKLAESCPCGSLFDYRNEVPETIIDLEDCGGRLVVRKVPRKF